MNPYNTRKKIAPNDKNLNMPKRFLKQSTKSIEKSVMSVRKAIAIPVHPSLQMLMLLISLTKLAN